MFSMSWEPRWLAPLIGAIRNPDHLRSLSGCQDASCTLTFVRLEGGLLVNAWLSLPPAQEGPFLLSKPRVSFELCYGVASRNSMVDLMESGLALYCTEEFLVKVRCYYFFPLNLELSVLKSAGFWEIIFEIKDELGRKDAGVLNHMVHLRQ